MKRTQKNLLTMLVLLGGGGGAFAYTYFKKIEPRKIVEQQKLEELRLLLREAHVLERTRQSKLPQFPTTSESDLIRAQLAENAAVRDPLSYAWPREAIGDVLERVVVGVAEVE